MSKIKPAIYFVRVIGESKPGVWTDRQGEKFTLIDSATTSWNAAEQFARLNLGTLSIYVVEVYCCSDEVKVERWKVRGNVDWQASPC